MKIIVSSQRKGQPRMFIEAANKYGLKESRLFFAIPDGSTRIRTNISQKSAQS